jgi:hypothetical protein
MEYLIFEGIILVVTIISVLSSVEAQKDLDMSIVQQKQTIDRISAQIIGHDHRVVTESLRAQNELDDYLMKINSLRTQMENYPNICWGLDIEIKRLRNMGAKLPWDQA